MNVEQGFEAEMKFYELQFAKRFWSRRSAKFRLP